MLIIKETVERALGPQEALFAELTRRSNGGVQLVTVARFEAPPAVANVRRALESIHQRHPMMRGRIEDRDALWWVCDVPFERIDIRTEAMGDAFDLEAFYACEAALAIDVMLTVSVVSAPIWNALFAKVPSSSATPLNLVFCATRSISATNCVTSDCKASRSPALFVALAAWTDNSRMR